MRKTIYYWSPCLTEVGTVKSTLNSAISLAKYEKNYDVFLLNVFGEWNNYEEYLAKKNVKLENLFYNYKCILPKYGFLKSRISYVLICILSFFPLLYFLKKKTPNILVMHLITSLPLLMINFFNFKTKFILRISGYPKLNFFRKRLWVRSNDKLFKVTSPTLELKKDLINHKIFKKELIEFLPDAIINIEQFREDFKSKNDSNKFEKYFLSVGRLTKQKNYFYLIDEFKKFLKKYPDEILIILGDGELKNIIKKQIKEEGLEKKILLLGKKKNVFSYMKNAKALILPSLWEEVGFVLVEAAISNLFLISSDCKNGPKEFLSYGKGGLLFNSREIDNLSTKLIVFNEMSIENRLQKKITAKKNSLKYTLFRHYKKINLILNNENKI